MILAIIGTTMLPWKLHQNFQNSKNAQNFMKLHSNDEQHWSWNFQNRSCYHGNNAKRSKISKIRIFRKLDETLQEWELA